MVQKELEVRRQLVEYEQPVPMGGPQYPAPSHRRRGNLLFFHIDSCVYNLLQNLQKCLQLVQVIFAS